MPSSRYKPFPKPSTALQAINVASDPYGTMVQTDVQNALQHLEDKAAGAEITAANAEFASMNAGMAANNAQMVATNAQMAAANAQMVANNALPRMGGIADNLMLSTDATAAMGAVTLSQMQTAIANISGGGGAGGSSNGLMALKAKGNIIIYWDKTDISNPDNGVIQSQNISPINTLATSSTSACKTTNSFNVVMTVGNINYNNGITYRVTFNTPMSTSTYIESITGSYYSIVAKNNAYFDFKLTGTATGISDGVLYISIFE